MTRDEATAIARTFLASSFSNWQVDEVSAHHFVPSDATGHPYRRPPGSHWVFRVVHPVGYLGASHEVYVSDTTGEVMMAGFGE
jgi:hypothetical protein